ncbi:MAG TPA: M28 family peptidase [Chitinophagaceae bacterium]|nr:M28 family peptidase [Chitinophagaceae bacterium]
MQLLSLVKYLENTSSAERCSIIMQVLKAWEIPFAIQEYSTGRNIIIYPNDRKPVVGVSSHFDVVTGSPGANDNASSVAVCLALAKRLQEYQFDNISIAVFFFDEEENGLKGSKAYVSKNGIGKMQSLVNLEMVGCGDKFALWPLNETSEGKVLIAFEKIAAQKNIYFSRFDKIVTNSADHVSFMEGGLKDVFTVTCISDEDLIVANEFFAAQERGKAMHILQSILKKAPLFKNYHQPTDVTSYLFEESLQMTMDCIWETLVMLDAQ